MTTISRDKVIYYFSKDNDPVIEIDTGEELLVETLDTANGTVVEPQDHITEPRKGVYPGKSNPQTGPIAIRGAKAGDTLVIEIISITPASHGFLGVFPGVALGNPRWGRVQTVTIDDTEIQFNDNIKLPIRPMIGTIGVAPAGVPVPTTHNGSHGGNLDLTAITSGTKVLLPISVDGGLLALGDVHACQGDGELAGSAIEVNSEVRLRCELLAGQHKRPMLETATAWITCACAADLEGALRLAIADMVELLEEKLGVNREEANMLVSAAGDARIGAAGGWGIDVTAAVEFPQPGTPNGPITT